MPFHALLQMLFGFPSFNRSKITLGVCVCGCLCIYFVFHTLENQPNYTFCNERDVMNVDQLFNRSIFAQINEASVQTSERGTERERERANGVRDRES